MLTKNVYQALSKMVFRKMLLILTMPALLYLQPRARNVLSTLLKEKRSRRDGQIEDKEGMAILADEFGHVPGSFRRKRPKDSE